MEYLAVRYDIDAGYKWGIGLEADKIAAFNTEVVAMFLALGWQQKVAVMHFSCPEFTLGKNSLYIHPMEITGVLDSTLVDSIEAVLKAGTTFKLNKVSKIEVLADISDEEYLASLVAKRECIAAEVLGSFPKGDYVSAPFVVESVKERHHVRRINSRIGRSCNDVEWRFVAELFEELKKEGKLVADPSCSYRYCRA